MPADLGLVSVGHLVKPTRGRWVHAGVRALILADVDEVTESTFSTSMSAPSGTSERVRHAWSLLTGKPRLENGLSSVSLMSTSA